MSGEDSIQINTRERASSSDVNDLQSLQARVLMDMLLYGQSLRTLGTPSDSARNVVLGGLIVTPTGSDVSVSPGMLLQSSASILPAPGPLVSPYRMSKLGVATTVTMPSPGGTTFYLIEAKTVQNVVSTVSVDIWDPVTQTFVPTSEPKRLENQITLQLVAGNANAPAPSGGDWVPIAIVRRPGGGGAVLASDIIDVRSLCEWGRERPAECQALSGWLSILDNTTLISAGGIALDGPSSLRGLDFPTAGTDIAAAAVLSPTTTLAANTWFYLYSCAWSALKLTPRFRGVTFGNTSEGVLVLSSVAPSALSRCAGAAIDLPPPYGVAQCAAADAYLVGAFRYNVAGTGFIAMQSSDLHRFDLFGGAVNGPIVAALSPPSGNNLIAPTAGILPTGIRRYRCNTQWVGAAGGSQPLIIAETPPGSTTIFGSRQSVDDVDPENAFDFEIDTDAFGGTSFRLTASGGAIDAGSVATARLVGYSL